MFSQYDHEVGIRTVIKPGFDGSVLRLDNGKFLSVKIDGNPKHCYIDPKDRVQLDALKRHVEMLFVLVQLQSEWLIIYNLVIQKILKYFGHLWNLLKGMTDFAKFLEIPCVGGKVSFYNETSDRSNQTNTINWCT